MFKEGKSYLLPLFVGVLILAAFHLCLARYLFQNEEGFTILQPLQRHVQELQLPQQPSRLSPTTTGPFFAPQEQQQTSTAPGTALRLAGIITQAGQHYALIEYAGNNTLYRLGDQLGAYQLTQIGTSQVVLRGEENTIRLALEKRP